MSSIKSVTGKAGALITQYVDNCEKASELLQGQALIFMKEHIEFVNNFFGDIVFADELDSKVVFCFMESLGYEEFVAESIKELGL